MLFITDKVKTLHIKTGDVVKLTLLHETTTFTNTGTDSVALIQYSTDGFTWKALTSIEPDSSTPLRLDKDILYVRLVSNTTLTISAVNGILRNQADTTTQIDLPSLVNKADLTDYVKKAELNDLVTPQDISQFLTKEQILKLIPKIPELPDLSGYALKTQLDTKASIDALNELNRLLLGKADQISVDSVVRAVGLLQLSYDHLNETKADKDNLITLTQLTEQAVNAAQMAVSTATYTQSQLQGKASSNQLMDVAEILIGLLDDKVTKSDFDALSDTVEEKASIQWVAQNTNFILGLIQDKANKVYVDEVNQKLLILSAVVNRDSNYSIEDFEPRVINNVFNKFKNSQEYQQLTQISLQNKEDVTLLRSDVDKHKVFTGFIEDTDLSLKVTEIIGD